MKADILRSKFLDFFKSKKHKIIASDSLVPGDDPTVLFTPAGMNQFKKEFLGFDSGFKRAASCQRCLRTDDLDKVGKTSSHHTFFEMLGNFSFGDYFKQEAIALAWEFMTQELVINKEKLWVSVYKDDEEAYNAWHKKIGLPRERIIKLGDKENFWPSEAKEKGPNGPCGTCSEIFFDYGENFGCAKPGCSPACSCGRFTEVWNLVFTQFNRKEGGALEALPHKNIDTGMGLERLAAVMQGVSNNFETDLFKPIVKEIMSGISSESRGQKEMVYAIADHLRAAVFAINDGAIPSNESRGYVIRKIIRKSALALRNLGYKGPFLYKLVPLLALIMKKPYPEIYQSKENIAGIILSEEKNFLSTLDSSESLFKEQFAAFQKEADPDEVGKRAFKLYDTYGVPLELTREWLNSHKVNLSQEAFDRELEGQKLRSKQKSSMKGDVFDTNVPGFKFKETGFIGYEDHVSKAKILMILKQGAPAKKAVSRESAGIIIDKTPFYPESGGQAGDNGEFIKGKNIFSVEDTKRSGKAIIHSGRVKAGSFKPKDIVTARVDMDKRLAIARNHTATHILQAVLKIVLGEHVKQQGSLVTAEKLRFDFAHFKDISEEQLSRIEGLVNGCVMDNISLQTKEMPLKQAKKAGALAFFGEKYGAKARVVSIGDFSKELCGGTHLKATGSIGLFKIMSEGSVASGVRRIEAITGVKAYQAVKQNEGLLGHAASSLNSCRENIVEEIEKKLSRLKELEKQLSSEKLNIIQSSVDSLAESGEVVAGIKVIAKEVAGLNIDLLRKNVDLIRQKIDNALIVLGSSDGNKAFLVIGITGGLSVKGLDASLLIREVAGLIGGSGGGRKDFAQAGGNNPQGLPAAFDKIKNIIAGRTEK